VTCNPHITRCTDVLNSYKYVHVLAQASMDCACLALTCVHNPKKQRFSGVLASSH
jgi:hypothetical protein